MKQRFTTQRLKSSSLARAAMTLLALFCFLGGANAQKTLPYEYSFENGNLVAEGWSKVDCGDQSAIFAGGDVDGLFQFMFQANSNHDQYLISPELDNSAPIRVLFYYKTWENDKYATFEVGYSSTTSDVSAFTWSEENSARGTWKLYEDVIPAGTKFVAIKYTCTSNDCQLCLDGFRFVKSTGNYGTWLVSCGSDNTAIINELNNQLGIAKTAAQALVDAAPCYVLKGVSEKEAKTLASPLIDNGAIAYAKDMTKHEGYITWLVSCGSSKMTVIKTLREKLNLGLKEAKDLADAAPCMVLESLSKKEAQALADALIADGAMVYVENLSGKTTPLPYTYGFENNNLAGEGWSLVNCDEYTRINYIGHDLGHEGNNCFLFHYNSNPPQYLISPQLEGTTGIVMSFYYKNHNDEKLETFQVGYSTTTNSPDAFTWGSEVTSNDKHTWKQYKATFPEGTQYVAVKLTSNDKYYLLLDDFCFEEADGIILSATEDNSAILNANKGQEVNVNFSGLTLKADTWNPLCLPFSMTAEQIAASPLAGATIHEYHSTQLDGASATMNFIIESTEIEAGFPYVVKFSGEDIMNPTFENVYIPTYPAAQAIGNNGSFIKGTFAPVVLEAGDKEKLFMQDGKLYRPENETTVNAFSFYFELMDYNNVTKFKVDYGIRQPLPYTYGFENNDLEEEGWNLVNCEARTEIQSEFAHEGNYAFKFRFTNNPPQYLISPQLEGTTGVAVSFYYKNINNDYPETFQVGYSTTGKSPDAFTWGDEVTASDRDTWKQYKATFPEGTKHVAVKLISKDQFNLYVDDFCFEDAEDYDETRLESINGNKADADDAWYALSGVKLNGKPTQKGVYIVNKKKVVMGN